MEQAVAKFKRDLPKLASLLEGVEEAGRKFGYLLSIDGRRGRIRYKGKTLALHTALNVLLQMTGSLIMKWSHIHAEDMAVAEGLIYDIMDFPNVCHMHDESQMEINEDEVDVVTYTIPEGLWKEEEKRQYVTPKGIWSAPVKGEVSDLMLTVTRYFHPLGDLYCRSIQWAGKHFGLRCQTDGEYKIGHSWLETH